MGLGGFGSVLHADPIRIILCSDILKVFRALVVISTNSVLGPEIRRIFRDSDLKLIRSVWLNMFETLRFFKSRHLTRIGGVLKTNDSR